MYWPDARIRKLQKMGKLEQRELKESINLLFGHADHKALLSE